MLEFQNLVLARMAKGSPLGETLDLLCDQAERFFPTGACSIVDVDEAGMLHPISGPAFPRAYLDALDGLPIGPDVGSCGSAIYHNRYVTVEDIETDPRWAMYKSLALPLGYRACSSLPIHGEDGKPIGALAVYFREKHIPSGTEREAMAACADLCGLVFSNERLHDRERIALVDHITALPNRTAFDLTLSQMRCELPGSWALLIIDIDSFRAVNDTFGNDAGDELLKLIGKRISGVVAPDTVFRTGGDEFTVILQGLQYLRDLPATANLLLRKIAAPVAHEQSTYLPQATIGLAMLAPQDVAPNAVLRNANFALYQAKETLRGGFIRYLPGVEARVSNRADAVRDVMDALIDGRIDVRYQPVVSVEECRVVGFEGLSCMRNAGGRIVPAAVFQEAFADARVATDLTQCILSTVARDARNWLDQGLPLKRIGVNVTSADFYFGNLAPKIEETFAEHGVPLGTLLVEVTENAYLGQRDQVVANGILELRARGIRVAHDDFGTGFAGLSHLLSVPVDCIKVDQSFVRKLAPGHPSFAIIHGMLQIAREIGISAVVEGIETEEQLELVRAMGGTLAQGFIFSRAVEREQAMDMLRKHGSGIERGTAMPLRPIQSR